MRTRARSIGVVAVAVVYGLLVIPLLACDATPNLPQPPYTCSIRAHNPHHSGHNPGRVNSEARVTCADPMDTIFVRATLYGRSGSSWRYLSDVSERRNNVAQLSAFAPTQCPGYNRTYKVVASGWAIYQGRHYDFNRNDANEATVNC